MIVSEQDISVMENINGVLNKRNMARMIGFI